MPAVIEIPVQKEYEKNPDIKSEDVKKIREWLMSQQHLPDKYITDLDIILAYHRCEHNIEDTKRVIDLNFTLRTLFSFYKDREINKSLENALKTWLICPLKTMTTKGYRGIYCQILDADPSNFVYSDVVRAFVMIMDLWQLEEGTVPGVVVILNMDQVLLGHLYQIDLAVAQQFFYFLQEAMFIRLKEFHIINAPSFIDRLLTMVKPFLKTEFLQMLKVHTVGSNTLDGYISRIEFLKEVGVMNSKEKRDLMWNKLRENRKIFENESRKRVDESKRSGKQLSLTDIFGIEDTFRALEID